ncbi:hypothetical protein C8R42DRAFT_681286 [Lentinula raphanica]|nr:hypothetical protein C8R42DRAFT_681286 [Lentinula raphanica]
MVSNELLFCQQLLPCGKVVPNRLVKVAMYEHLASIRGGPPNRYHYALYSTWSEHDWGMIVTGNVIVSQDHLTLGRDMVVPRGLDDQTIRPFQKLAESIHGNKANRPLAIMQLSHGGRQSSNFLGGRLPFVPPLAPSALRSGQTLENEGIISNIFHLLLFQKPKAMSLADLDHLVSEFVRGAVLASQSGFDGIQLHAAHGYLLAQFLSPKSNIRTDEYSHDSLLLLNRIVNAIRKAVPASFILGIKFNTGDYSGVEESKAQTTQDERAISHLREIVAWRTIDFIEITGGDYENPNFVFSPGSTQSSRSSRQAFFARFSARFMKELSSMSSPNDRLPLVLLTGGLRTPAHLYNVIASNHAHLLGIGRSSVLCPELPTTLKNNQTTEVDLFNDFTPFKPEPDLSLSFTKRWPWTYIWRFVPRIKLIGAGVGIAWYALIIRQLAEGRIRRNDERDIKKSDEQNAFDLDYSVTGIGAVVKMWVWVNAPEIQKSYIVLLLLSLLLMVLCLAWSVDVFRL